MGVTVSVILGLAIGAIILIVWAPWRRVRAEGPLPPDVEAQVLLGGDPARPGAERRRSTARSRVPRTRLTR